MNNKMENKKDVFASDMALALISYVESHLIETVGWHLDATEFDTEEDYLEMHEAVIDKLIGMLSGKE